MDKIKLPDEKNDKLFTADESLNIDIKDMEQLRDRYDSLPLILQDRMLINDYIACVCSMYERKCELMYLAGLRDSDVKNES